MHTSHEKSYIGKGISTSDGKSAKNFKKKGNLSNPNIEVEDKENMNRNYETTFN